MLLNEKDAPTDLGWEYAESSDAHDNTADKNIILTYPDMFITQISPKIISFVRSVKTRIIFLLLQDMY